MTPDSPLDQAARGRVKAAIEAVMGDLDVVAEIFDVAQARSVLHDLAERLGDRPVTAGDMFERGTVWKCTRCGGVSLYRFAGNCMMTSADINVRHHEWERVR